jgi:hypothetical protein
VSAANLERCHVDAGPLGAARGGAIPGTRPSLAGRTQAGPFGIKFLIGRTEL